MATRNTATKINPDHTDHRIRAFLASMQSDPDTEFNSEIKTQINRGRSLIEHLAIDAAGGMEPDLKLSPADCADILTYMSSNCPISPRAWWNDNGAISHVCGYHAILDAMADSLRPGEGDAAEASGAGTESMPAATADLVKLRTDRLYQETLSTQSVLKCVRDLIIEGLDGGEAGGAEVAEVVRMAIEKLGDICNELDSGFTGEATDEERQELAGTQS